MLNGAYTTQRSGGLPTTVDRPDGSEIREPARIEKFSSPLQRPESKVVDLPFEGRVTHIPFELQVRGDTTGMRAELWTNANRSIQPDCYEAVPMALASKNEGLATYRVELPIERIGNYRASARIRRGEEGTPQWAQEAGQPDILFRPRDVAHDRRNVTIVNVGMANFDPRTRRSGTFSDLMDSGSPATNGRYTLDFLVSRGVTTLWLQGIMPNRRWEHAYPEDDAGSPYAVTDYFSVRPELSEAARGEEDTARARDRAIDEFDAFSARCQALGIDLMLDVALNHVGHNFTFRDLFVLRDASGRALGREVRANDFSQVVTSEADLDAIKARLANPNIPDYMEWIAPQMYGRPGDPNGARAVEETVPGGWFEWPDTKQLNIGRFRPEPYRWADAARLSSANDGVLSWLGRVLQYWAIDRGVSGFRFDHLTGLPTRFLEKTLNELQAAVDAHTDANALPRRSIYVVGEDFHTLEVTRPWMDNMQGGFFHCFRSARTPESFMRVIDNPWRHDLLALGSHDEGRLIHHFGSAAAATRMLNLLTLVGGPVLTVMGDELGESEKLRFMQNAGVPSIRHPYPVSAWIEAMTARAGRARLALKPLESSRRARLSTIEGTEDPDLLALSRFPHEPQSLPALVIANFAKDRRRARTFRLDDETKIRLLSSGEGYQVRDLMGDDPAARLWPEPKTALELIANGLYVDLAPEQVQCLSLVKLEDR